MAQRCLLAAVLLLAGCSQFTRTRTIGQRVQTTHGIRLGNEKARLEFAAGAEAAKYLEDPIPISTVGAALKIEKVSFSWWVDILFPPGESIEQQHFTCIEVSW